MSNEVISDVDELISKLRSVWNAGESVIIAIDGMYGSGKSGLARELFYRIRDRHVRLIYIDDYLKEQVGEYRNYIDYQRLKEDILRLARISKPLLIVDGILALEVLKKTDVTPTLHIYVIPQDDNPKVRFYDHIYAEDDELRSRLGRNMEPLEKEIRDYHRMYKPNEKAHFRFKHAGNWREN